MCRYEWPEKRNSRANTLSNSCIEGECVQMLASATQYDHVEHFLQNHHAHAIYGLVTFYACTVFQPDLSPN
jgi:hypothetical protein